LASCSYLDEATANGLEKMLSDARNKDAGEFLQLWDMFGRFLLDPRRSKFLLDAAETLGPSGKPFLHLCSWLIRNGSPDVRPRCSLMLAGFYADMGNPDKASALIRGIKGNRDDVLRVKARIYKDKTKYQNAMAAIFSIREMKPADLLFLTDMLDQTKNITKAVRFCEKSLNAAGAPPKVYIKLADALYKIGRKRDALRFYKTIASLSPGNEKGLTKDDIAWAYYMLLKLSGGDDPFVIPGPAVQGDTVFSRSEEASLKEAHILERIKEVL
jgi:tetratricopeptide (TPR) repeat protein